MEKLVLEAKERKIFTKSFRNELRKNNVIPGIFYSRHGKPTAIAVTEKALKPFVYTSTTHLISLKVENNEEMECVVRDVQFDPLTDKVIHFDLLGLTKGEKFQLEVPVQIIGSPVGVKEGGVLQHLMHRIEIECLPINIPEHITVNVTDLKLNDAIHVGDLQLPDITILSLKDAVVVSVVPPKVEKVVTEAEAEAEAEVGAEEERVEPELVSKSKESGKEKEKEKE